MKVVKKMKIHTHAYIPWLFSAALLLTPLCISPSVFAQQAQTPSQEQQDLDFADGLYQRGLYDSAARQYAEFIRKYPGSANLQAAQFRRAESLYQESIAQTTKDPVRSKVAQVEARAEFQDFIKKFVQSERIHEALLRIGEISYKMGDADTAIPALDRIIAEAKDNNLLEAALFYSARSHERKDHFNTAEKHYRQLRDTFPKSEYAAYATYMLAEMLEKQNKELEAVNVLNDLWKNPDRFTIPKGSNILQDAQLRAAQLLYKQENYAEAAKAYRSYVALNPTGENADKARYGAAWAEYQAGNYAGALEIANSLQQGALEPVLAAGILFLKGTCSYQQKQYEDAIRFFREVIADPNAGDYRERAWYQLAWSYYLTGQYEDAVRESNNLLQQSLPVNLSANVHFLQAQALAQQSRYSEAISELRLVLQMDAESEFAREAMYLYADLLYRSDNYSEAAQAFVNFYERYPNADRAQEALLWATNARFSAKEFDRAIETADQLLNKFPNVESKNDILYRKALAHYQLKQYGPALKTFEDLLASKSDDRKADALYWQAYIHELQKEFTKSSQIYARLLEEYPQFENADEVVLRKALSDYQSDNREEAYDSFMQVLQSDQAKELPAEIIFWMIFQADEQDKHEEALGIAEKIIEQFDDPSIRERAMIAKGNELVILQRWDAALKNGAQFQETFPESLFKPEIHWSMAKAYEGLKQNEKALEAYEKSLEEITQLGNPDPAFEASLYVDRGRLLQTMGKPEAALESLLRVAIIFDHPELTPEAMYRSVQCHLKLDEKTEAGTMYDELLERYPDSDWSTKAITDFGEIME